MGKENLNTTFVVRRKQFGTSFSLSRCKVYVEFVKTPSIFIHQKILIYCSLVV